MIDNSEHLELLNILENLEDEILAVNLLKELNDASSNFGKKMMNLDERLSHDVWKKECDDLKLKLDKVIDKIKNLSE